MMASSSKKLKTVNIKGKEYVEVNERVKHFREDYPDWCIETEMLSNDDGVCVFKATIKDENGVAKAVGHAYEKESSSFINKTSYIENCETSAVGRALGMAGFGIDTSVASYEEVGNAIANQEANKPITKGQVKCLVKLAEAKGSDLSEICDYFGVGTLEEMTAEEYGKCLDMLNRKASVNG